MSEYAWLITRDHLAEADPNNSDTDAGTVGPRDITDDQRRLLTDGGGDTFRMYDDDGELYYTGRCVAADPDTEEACVGPLKDYGLPNAGCTLIRWDGFPYRDCEA